MACEPVCSRKRTRLGGQGEKRHGLWPSSRPAWEPSDRLQRAGRGNQTLLETWNQSSREVPVRRKHEEPTWCWPLEAGKSGWACHPGPGSWVTDSTRRAGADCVL